MGFGLFLFGLFLVTVVVIYVVDSMLTKKPKRNNKSFCSLPQDQFDHKGNIDFTEVKAEKQSRGGLPYFQPDQWTRYGLKVLGQYKNDKWLTDWEGGWANGYHGFSETRGNNRTQSEKHYTYAIKNIVDDGLKPGSNQAYEGNRDIKTKKRITRGVYFASQAESAESYCSPIDMEVKIIKLLILCLKDDSSHQYKIIIQCRLKPKAIQYATKDYYVVEDNKHIRPYGILWKKWKK